MIWRAAALFLIASVSPGFAEPPQMPVADVTTIREMLADGQMMRASLETAMQENAKLTKSLLKATLDLADAEAQKSTLVEWLKKAQAKGNQP